MSVALVHDYLTQRGGAERVLLSFVKAFPGAPLHTSLYNPGATFEEFRTVDVRPQAVNRVHLLRRHHRLALPLLATTFSRLRVDEEVAVCTSSGWAHGARAMGAKIVYCYAPPRWLYQGDRYLGDRGRLAAAALRVLEPSLLRWDRRAAAGADRYLTSSRAMQELIREVYGREAELLPPPQTIDAAAPRSPVEGECPGFYLCVSRLLPYKNVDAIVQAFSQMPARRLLVAGDGPDLASLRATAPGNVRLLGTVSDAELRWLYASARGLVAASYEDFGLTPLEAAAFGTPSAVLRFGGFLDTVRDGETGVYFDTPTRREIAAAVDQLERTAWDEPTLRAHAAAYSESRFVERLRSVVGEHVSSPARAVMSPPAPSTLVTGEPA